MTDGVLAALSSGQQAADDAADLRRLVHQALERAGVDAPTRPATAKLTSDQADLVVDLLDGFTSRREILEWGQRLVIQTLGQLPDEWYSETAADAPTVSALLGEPWGPVGEFDRDLAREIRRGIVANDLLPAFHAAHQEFRWAAVERVDHLDDEGEGDAPEPIDPEAQEYPLMRPAFGELAGHQRETLGQLLAGFETPDRLLVWCVQVIGGTYAELAAEDAVQPYFEGPLRAHLLNPRAGERDTFVRESWAAEYLLPAFNRAAAQLAARAQEVTASGTDYDSTTASIS